MDCLRSDRAESCGDPSWGISVLEYLYCRRGTVNDSGIVRSFGPGHYILLFFFLEHHAIIVQVVLAKSKLGQYRFFFLFVCLFLRCALLEFWVEEQHFVFAIHNIRKPDTISVKHSKYYSCPQSSPVVIGLSFQLSCWHNLNKDHITWVLWWSIYIHHHLSWLLSSWITYA